MTGRASPLAKMPYCPVLAGERGEPVLLSLFLKYTIFFRGELSSLHLGRDTQKHHSRGTTPTSPAFPLTPSGLSPARRSHLRGPVWQIGVRVLDGERQEVKGEGRYLVCAVTILNLSLSNFCSQI